MEFFSRKRIQVALLCYTAFLLYATLWPFDFHFFEGFAATGKTSWIPFFDPVEGPGRRDAVLNIIVFVPFGALIYLLTSSGRNTRRALLLTIVAGAALSLSVEVAQIWLPSRSPSIADLLMNATGALLGALLARSWERKVRTDAEGVHLFLRRNATAIAMIVYALALLASTMRTFDPILRWEPLYIYARAQAFAASNLLPDHLDLDYTAWMVLSFGFLSFLAAEGFSGASTIRRCTFRYVAVFVSCSGYAVALEALQILFRSRNPLRSHALLGIMGVVYGLAWHFASAWFRVAAPSRPIQGGILDSGTFRRSTFKLLFFIHYVMLILLAFLSPIPHTIGDFRFDPRGFIPFFFYLRDISLPSLYAASRTIALYIPVGILMHRAPDAIRNRIGRMPVLFSFSLQSMIEICRGFSGNQYPDPSNVFLAALGSYAGDELLKRIHSNDNGWKIIS